MRADERPALHLGGLEKRLAAQVMVWFGGEQGGHGLASVLTGAVEPSGRLTLSVPRSAGASPYFYNHKFKSSGTPIARHFGSNYPFGHGLSYTRFEYSELALVRESVSIVDGEIELSLALRNVGDRAGVEIVQLYVRDPVASLVRPVKELRGFARVSLDAGAASRVAFALPVDMLGFTGPAGVRIVEPGAFPVVRRRARSPGVVLSGVPGTGPYGRIRPGDLDIGIRQRPAAAPAPGAPVSRGPAGNASAPVGIPPLPEIDFSRFGEIERAAPSRIGKLSRGDLEGGCITISSPARARGASAAPGSPRS